MVVVWWLLNETVSLKHFFSKLCHLTLPPTNLTIHCAGEKRPKVKKPKVEFPVYEPTLENVSQQSYNQTTSIEEIEDQMDDWLQDRKSAKRKV